MRGLLLHLLLHSGGYRRVAQAVVDPFDLRIEPPTCSTTTEKPAVLYMECLYRSPIVLRRLTTQGGRIGQFLTFKLENRVRPPYYHVRTYSQQHHQQSEHQWPNLAPRFSVIGLGAKCEVGILAPRSFPPSESTLQLRVEMPCSFNAFIFR